MNPLLTYRYISIRNTENLKKNKNNSDKKDPKKQKDIRKGSGHLQQWMWTGLRLQQPDQWPSDWRCVMCTAYCRGVRATAWLAFFMHRGWTGIPAADPRLFGTPTPRPVPLIRIRLGTFSFLAAMHIWQKEQQQGPSMLDPYFLWVSVCGSTTWTVQTEDWADNKQTLHCWTFDNSQRTYGRWCVVVLCVFRNTYFIFI